MKFTLPLLFLFFSTIISAQTSSDNKLSDFTTKYTIPFTMPDGIQLMTDVYLPILSRPLSVEVDLGSGPTNIVIIKEGTQVIVYDSLNGGKNPNMFQLPMVITRTPYGKDNDDDISSLMPFLGYAFAKQDLRGRYDSQGVDLPLYNDGWRKDTYHPNFSTTLDVLPIDDPANGNFHEDGKNFIKYVTDSLRKNFDLDFDGTAETNALLYNGSLGMIGASASGYAQYQAASAYKVDPTKDGLKCLTPVVATNEHYNTSLYNNGVFRQGMVSYWLIGQLNDVNDTVGVDNSYSNNLHTTFDYGNISKEELFDRGLDYVSANQENGIAAAYANSYIRQDLDAMQAPVDENGNSAANGPFNRYTNMEVPAYHLTGWWDIFINGQIETFNNMKNNISATNGELQKMVIGPWSHKSIGNKNVGDMNYKDNAIIEQTLGFKSRTLSPAAVINSELLHWLRYNLNYDENKKIGEPKFYLPENKDWQILHENVLIRVPSKDTYIPLNQIINYFTGNSSLDVPVQLKIGSITTSVTYSIKPGKAMIEGDALTSDDLPFLDFKKVQNVRFYVVGPINDGVPQNESLGNYWFESDDFPLKSGINYTPFYLHQNRKINNKPPEMNEGSVQYFHDPNDPVATIGGNNFTFPTPQGGPNHGQMNLANPKYINYTMNHPGVISFETNAVEDSLSIIGFSKVKLYAESTPNGEISGETDTDFFIRVLDVYPDGKQFYVFEGAVNARAREYARSLYSENEDVNAEYSNINIGQVYEYEFNTLPIAYTFGKNHKMKILISSSNYLRYQVNPNLPINDNEFFRRDVNDGKTYNFKGVDMAPRIATQSIHFSKNYPSQIILPVFGNFNLTSSENVFQKTSPEIKVYPNPAKDHVMVNVSETGDYKVNIYSITGILVKEELIRNSNNTDIQLDGLKSGIYVLEVSNSKMKQVSKVCIQ